MLPILVCSVLTLAICLERLWSLAKNKVLPDLLVEEVLEVTQTGMLSDEYVEQLAQESPLGTLIAAGIHASKGTRERLHTDLENAFSVVAHGLERYVDVLGTIAAITPLLGLLGTVIGMIDVFNQIMLVGTGNPHGLAGGISEALVTTAAGLLIAIPALIMHRYFQRKIDYLVVCLEQKTKQWIEQGYPLIHNASSA